MQNSYEITRYSVETIQRDIRSGIVIEKVNLVRATLNEAYEMKDNLLEDGLDYDKIIVDLSNCDYVDSTFLGALIYSYRKIKEKDGQIVLVIGEQCLTNSFIFREISSIFKVYNSIKDAIDEMKNYKIETLREEKQNVSLKGSDDNIVNREA